MLKADKTIYFFLLGVNEITYHSSHQLTPIQPKLSAINKSA
jgi:hypothetical protein